MNLILYNLIFILIFDKFIYSESSLVVCSSIKIQGPVDINKLAKIKNCSLVIGHVQILNAKFLDFNQTNSNVTLFPNLVEITDYLLIFQAQNLNNLNSLFPKLSIIRGNHLFKNYALIIFLTNSLLYINLKSLIQIDKGSVLISRLYHTCYVNTIDWDYLIKNKTSLKPSISLFNNDCFSQNCRPECKNSFNSNSNCWNEKNCQLKCPSECLTNCNLDNVSECCSDPLCSYCRHDDENEKNATTCISCSKYRDLSTGKCVTKCPLNTVIYEQNICLKIEDCSLNQNSLVQNYNLLDGKECVRKCPIGHKTIQTEIMLKNRTFKFQECSKCDDNICKKDCSKQSFHIKKLNDLEGVKNCHKVKRLIIELDSDLDQHLLTENLQYLEEINEYLIITRNRYLTSLNFLKSLKLIRGIDLFERKFSLFVHTNSRLRDLWVENKLNFSILNGTVKFFENPELCYQHIENFLVNSKILNIQDSEISFNFNGYRRLTCSNKTIELKFELKPNKILVSWNVTVFDLRRLKGFVLSYVEVPDEFNFDQNNIDYKLGLDHGSLDDEWYHLYVEYGEKISKNLIQVSLDVEPFTRYAVYVKADLTMESNWNMINRSYSHQYDRLISKINYIYSLEAQPSKVEEISYEPISYDQIHLKWKSPKRPNGIIEFYFIAYTRLKDLEILQINSDNCQFDQYLTSSNYDSDFKISQSRSSTVLPVTKSPLSTSTYSNLQVEDQKKLCIQSSKMYDYRNEIKLKKIQDDIEKNNIISVEDEIYNLAFRPARIQSITKKPNTFRNITSTIENFLNNTIESLKNNSSQQTESMLVINYDELLSAEDYNLNESLLRLVRRDLFIQEDQAFNIFRTPNKILNLNISNLTSFGRYVVSIIACQNYTKELKSYIKSWNKNNQNSKPTRNDLLDYLRYFSIENYCSKPNLITFRSKPDERLDIIPDSSLSKEDDIWYFKWTKPNHPNGFIYKYNLKFIDIKSNKTHGPLCHAALDNLKVALNQFLLAEGHEYLIQVQAVSTAGPGPWSFQTVKYSVPSLSQYSSQIIGAVVSLMIILIITFFLLKKYNESKDKGYFSIKSHYYYFRPDEWEIKRENLIIGERIGSGCFAEVHKGQLKLKTNELVDCAIKFCGSDHQSRQRLLKEANMMKSINTTHIVKMLGVISKDNPAYLILEFMDKGDLKEYLKSFKSFGETIKNISMDRFYRIAAEIADGMLWLSEHKYIHRDLAARNCLISKDDIIKIADLGLSKDIYQNPVYREKCKALLPIRWMSPESLIDGSSTTKSDVWSYGVVIWEMATYGDNPYNGKENEEVIEFVKQGGKLDLPMNSPLKFFILINKCMVTEDFKRINFKDVLDILDPDLTNDFKKTSYYHNDFRKKINKRKSESNGGNSNNKQTLVDEKQINVIIADPCFGDSDNYM